MQEVFIDVEGGRHRKRVGIGGVVVTQCINSEISVHELSIHFKEPRSGSVLVVMSTQIVLNVILH